jgi:hypothetical protein
MSTTRPLLHGGPQASRTRGGSHVPTSISSRPGTRAAPGAARECADFRHGPGGLTLAYWLSRRGFCPTVVERAPTPRDGGQAVDIRGAAIDVTGRAGILGALRQARTRTRGMTYVSATGKHLASMNAAFGVIDAADVEIVRGDLAGILHRLPGAPPSTPSAIRSPGWPRCPEPSRSPSSGPNRARSIS